MSDQSAERLAPVAYLPWVAPSSDESERVAAPARRSSRHPAGRALGGRPPVRIGPSGRDRDGDDDESAETGLERDERIDRIIVSRLRRSSLSIAEVRAALVEHGLDDHEVEEWIERYVRLGYLDDRRLAEQLVHSHAVRRGRGSGALVHELSRRGIDAELARDALDALDPEVEFANASEVAVRRARQLAGLDRATAERRLSAFLLRRGYGSDVVRRAVTAALEGEPTD